MKRSFKLISILLCLVLAATFCTACSAHGAPDHSVDSPRYAVSESDLERELDAFMDGHEDRTSFKPREAEAAGYIKDRLISFGYNGTVVQDVNAKEYGVERLTQNVVARFEAKNRTADTKNVILGAYYDNRYAEAYDGDSARNKSDAALAGGTGVATLLVIAEYLAKKPSAFDFDVTIVFFGASYVTAAGAEAYYDAMTIDERDNTVLMVELQRLGCDYVYAFSDARQTNREPFFDKVAKDNSLDVYKVTSKSPLVTVGNTLDGIPYYQWAHNGVFGTFFNAKIPTLNLVGANWESIDLGDAESGKNNNIAYTQRDTLENLKAIYPDYASKMATAATLVVRSLESPEFLQTMIADRENFPDTSVLTKSWIWYLVVIGFAIVAAGILMLVVWLLGKKYQPEAEQPRKVKMAVFGMDYEDASSADIFIDTNTKTFSPDEEIFPGISNNKKVIDPFDLMSKPNDDKPIDPFDHSDGE